MAKQQMLINHVHDEESRIALVEDNRLEELYTERASADLHVGNIYRGRVTNIEPSIQAAFVDFGEERAGFLHITDLHPRYFPGEDRESSERIGHKTPRKERPPIQKSLKRGQEILVQVLKEGIGNKGPTLTSYLSIPGRYLVMLPHMERHGVSRKVEDPEQRKQMLKLLEDLNPPQDMGFIIRTAGMSRPKTELKRDLNYLLRLWKNIEKRSRSGKGPAELYTESDLVIRTLRDVLTTDVRRIIVDERVAALRARDFLRIAMPRSNIKVYHYTGSVPLFDAFDVERQIQQINQRHVPLDCGGSLVFDTTEALVAVDVNSGRFRDTRDPEETAYRTNKEAVEEIARQLRLRDLGGLLVLDLIDMYVNRHRRDVERRFRTSLKKDRARTKVLKISDLGMLEMTRQRMRPSLKKSIYDECNACGGTGQILSPESAMLEAMRRVAVAISAKRVARVEIAAHPQLLTMLLNRRRSALVQLERETGKSIESRYEEDYSPDHFELICFDSKDGKVDLDKLPEAKQPDLTNEDEITIDDLKELERHLQAESRLQAAEPEMAEAAEQAEETEPTEEGGRKKKRRRRRRRSKKSSEAADRGEEQAGAEETGRRASETTPSGDGKPETEQPAEPSRTESSEEAVSETGAKHESAGEKRKRRRRRRGGRRRRKSSAAASGESTSGESGTGERPFSSEPAAAESGSAESDRPAELADASPSSGYERGPSEPESKSRSESRGEDPAGLEQVLQPLSHEGGSEDEDREESRASSGASGNGAVETAEESASDDRETAPSRGTRKAGPGRKRSGSKRSRSRRRSSENAEETKQSESSAEPSSAEETADEPAQPTESRSSKTERDESEEPPRVTRADIAESVEQAERAEAEQAEQTEPAGSESSTSTTGTRKKTKRSKQTKQAKQTKQTKKTKKSKTTKKTKKTAAKGSGGSSRSGRSRSTGSASGGESGNETDTGSGTGSAQEPTAASGESGEHGDRSAESESAGASASGSTGQTDSGENG